MAAAVAPGRGRLLLRLPGKPIKSFDPTRRARAPDRFAKRYRSSRRFLAFARPTVSEGRVEKLAGIALNRASLRLGVSSRTPPDHSPVDRAACGLRIGPRITTVVLTWGDHSTPGSALRTQEDGNWPGHGAVWKRSGGRVSTGRPRIARDGFRQPFHEAEALTGNPLDPDRMHRRMERPPPCHFALAADARPTEARQAQRDLG